MKTESKVHRPKHWRLFVAFLLVLGSIFLASCSSDSDDDSDSSGGSGGGGGGGTTTTLLSGTVQTSTASSAPQFEGAISFKGQTSRVSYAEAGANCTVQALDAKTEAVIAETTSDANGNYEFTDAQIAANTSYKILTICNNKKMSSYVSTGDTEVVQNVTPATTAIAAFVKKALVQAVQNTLDSLGEGISDSAKQSIKDSVLDMIDSIVTAVVEQVEELVENGSMTVPDDIDSANTLEDAVDDFSPDDVGEDASADLDTLTASLETAETTLEASEKIYVPPTLDEELEGAASQGVANAQCDPSRNEFGSDDDERAAACSRTLTDFFIKSLKWGIYFDVSTDASGDAQNAYGSETCAVRADGDATADGFPFDKATIKAEVEDGNICKVFSTIKPVDRNGDGRENGDDDMGMGENTIFAFAQAMRAGNQYTMQGINNIVFATTGTGENTAGWNARVVAVDPSENMYVYNDSYGFKDLSISQRDFYGYGEDEVNSARNLKGTPDWEPKDGVFSGAFGNAIEEIKGATSNSVYFDVFGGDVPSKQEMEEDIDNERAFGEHNPSGRAEYEVLISEARRYGPIEEDPENHPGEFTENPCEDGNANTECVDQDGNNYSDRAIKVKLSFGKIDDAGSENHRFRYISAVGDANNTDERKNFYLRPVWSEKGATGTFNLINVDSGKELRSPRGQEVVIGFIRHQEQCDSSDDLFGDLDCVAGDVDKAVEFWLEWEQDSSTDSWEPSYTLPRGNAVDPKMTVGGTVATTIADAAVTFIEEDHESNYEYFFCPQSPYDDPTNDTCNDGHRWDRLRMHPVSSREVMSGDASFNNIRFDASGNVNANGEYFAQSNWSCTDPEDHSTCAPSGYFFYKLIGYEGSEFVVLCDPGDVSTDNTNDTWFENDGNPISACGVNQDTMVNNLDTAGGEAKAAIQRHFHTAVVPNASHNPLLDPWLVTFDDSSTVSFSKQWEVVDYALQGYWMPDGDSKTQRCSLLLTQYETECLDSDNGNNVDWEQAQEYFDWGDPRIARRKSAYRFADPSIPKKLMSFAFEDSFFDGTKTITESTTFNALQAFAFIFFYFEGNSSPVDVADFANWGDLEDVDNKEWSEFRTMMPSMDGGEGDGFWSYLENALDAYKEN